MKDMLSEFKNGRYEFKEPWRATDKSLTIVVPIVSNNAGRRNYVVLDEVKEKVRITDTGGISKLQIGGDINEPVFVRGGTMLKGSTQERATQFGFVVVPSKHATIPVHCIHATRGIRAGTGMQLGGSAPMRVYSSILASRNQSETWSAVKEYTFHSSNKVSLSPELRRDMLSASDDLARTVDALERFRKDLQKTLERIPDYVDQVGIAMIDPDGVVGLEVYDHPDSWKAFSQSIIRSFSDNLSKEDKAGLFKPDMSVATTIVKEFLNTVESFGKETVFSEDNTETVVLRGKGYVGEFTRLKDKTIHLLITRSVDTNFGPLFPSRHEPRLASINADRVVSLDAGMAYGTSEGQRARRSAISRFFNWGKRKSGKGKEVLSALKEEPKTWTNLKTELDMSKATLSSRLSEFQERGAVERHEGENGKTRYGLTGIGQELLSENGKLGNKELSTNSDRVHSQFKRPAPPKTPLSECPKCHSKNVILRFDKLREERTCTDCKHKWTRPRRE